jgi:hypothetical protein
MDPSNSAGLRTELMRAGEICMLPEHKNGESLRYPHLN